ncbi:hypothetical protein, conserved [Angomonas deanei]|uniref:Tetratricopeptide repeat n=1 Tax=Angomonas deanei TaxID=59799 RepID=A0A7G2CTN6_9TRYP|nr:hypothetical protein, conserved [Angomonas deanei]
MFRQSVRRQTRMIATSVPPNFTYAIDMAFYFPRFQPRTHIQSMNIPEIKDAQALLQHDLPEEIVEAERFELGEKLRQQRDSPKTINEKYKNKVSPLSFLTEENMFLAGWTSSEATPAQLQQREKGLVNLERGIDILESINAGQYTNTTIMNILRPLYATRFALLQGVEHLPRPSYAKHVHVQKKILEESAKLLYYNDTWDKSDVQLIDTACVILCHFIKSFIALHPVPFNQPPPPPSGIKGKGKSAGKPARTLLPMDWSMKVNPANDPSAVLTTTMVMERIEELLLLAQQVQKTHVEKHPELRWVIPKLLLLKGLWYIPLNGNLTLGLHTLQEAMEAVRQFTAYNNAILEGLQRRPEEIELGLYNLVVTEMQARIFGWDLIEPEHIDERLFVWYKDCADFFSVRFDTAIDADGIMNPKYFPTRTMEILSYNCASVSLANFLLQAPRPAGSSTKDTPVFLPKQTFDLNPLRLVGTPSDMFYNQTEEVESMSVNKMRSVTHHALERALTLNRGLFPEQRQNNGAAHILQSMASLYADTRDYLHATGLYESALKTLVEQYGAHSLEVVHLHRLRYEFLSGVGSEEEAKAASHEIIHLLKAMDALPH